MFRKCGCHRKIIHWIFHLKLDENFFHDIIVSRNLKKITWLSQLKFQDFKRCTLIRLYLKLWYNQFLIASIVCDILVEHLTGLEDLYIGHRVSTADTAPRATGPNQVDGTSSEALVVQEAWVVGICEIKGDHSQRNEENTKFTGNYSSVCSSKQ